MKPFISILLLLSAACALAQNWSLKLSSNVELRTWKLNTSAVKTEKSLSGARIALYKGESLIGETTSDASGDFVIDIPGGGDFILTVSAGGCNTKKFYVSTKNVPTDVGTDNYKPTVSIGGFVMSKPIKGVDYIGLNEPLVKVEYKANGQNFDKDDNVTNQGLNIISRISDSENKIIETFCSANKKGDEAMRKKNCPLAKTYYQKALETLPDETYPYEQLQKAEECIRLKQEEEKAQAEENARKAEAARLAAEKGAADRKKAEEEKQAKQAAAKATNTAAKTAAPKTETVKSETNVIQPKNSESPAKSSESASKGNSRYKMPQVLGADKYKQAIGKADNYFKSKRYQEAQLAYEEALKVKSNDTYATSRITECKKLLGTP